MIAPTKIPKTPRRSTVAPKSKKPRVVLANNEQVVVFPEVVNQDELVAKFALLSQVAESHGVFDSETEPETIDVPPTEILSDIVDEALDISELVPGVVLEKIVCECGSIVTKKSMAKHLKTAKHLKYMASLASQSV